MTDWPGTPAGGDNQWPGTPKKRGMIDQLLGETGPRYQTWPERAVRNLATLPQRFIESAGAAPPGSKESVEAEVGPAFEAATLAAPMGKTGAPVTVRGASAAAPTQEALRGIISQQYGELDKLGIQIPQKDVADFANQLRLDLRRDGYRPLNQPGTFGALDELKEAEGRFTDIDSVRKVLGKIRADVARNKSDAEAARMVIGKIDEFLSSRTGETGDLAKSARGNVSALKKSEQVTAAQESAELRAGSSGSGANLANSIRQQMRSIVDPKYPQRQLGFKPDEIALMKEIATGGGRYSAENIARLMSKLGPDHPLSGWGAAILSGHGIATLGLGKLAQWFSERQTIGKIQRLDEMIRRRAPAAGPQQTRPMRSTDPLAALYRTGAAPLIAGAPDRYQTQQLGDIGL